MKLKGMGLDLWVHSPGANLTGWYPCFYRCFLNISSAVLLYFGRPYMLFRISIYNFQFVQCQWGYIHWWYIELLCQRAVAYIYNGPLMCWKKSWYLFTHKSDVMCWDGAVNLCFNCCGICCRICNFTRVVNYISSNSKSCYVGFIFLWFDSTDYSSVFYFPILWGLWFWNEEDCVWDSNSVDHCWNLQ